MKTHISIQILSSKVICKEPGRYIGWPTIARTPRDELLVVFSGDRDAHVCPYGKMQLIRSQDSGKTWSAPETIIDTPLDDRDAGLVAMRDSTLVVSWFTSFNHPDDPQLARVKKELRESWRPYVAKITEADKVRWAGSSSIDGAACGHWISRSQDNGITWEEPVPVKASAPHGPIELADGRLLFVGNDSYERDKKNSLIVAEESCDQGRTWKVIGTIPMFVDDQGGYLCEPHAVEVSPGRLVAMFRYERHSSEGGLASFLWQAESSDGGRSWSALRQMSIWGKPPHLIRLKNGYLLVSYGHRRKPFGERACFSYDSGQTWDYAHEVILRDDAPNSDLGYPASVELEDGSILTVYYQIDQPGEKTCLMATHWRVES